MEQNEHGVYQLKRGETVMIASDYGIVTIIVDEDHQRVVVTAITDDRDLRPVDVTDEVLRGGDYATRMMRVTIKPDETENS